MSKKTKRPLAQQFIESLLDNRQDSSASGGTDSAKPFAASESAAGEESFVNKTINFDVVAGNGKPPEATEKKKSETPVPPEVLSEKNAHPNQSEPLEMTIEIDLPEESGGPKLKLQQPDAVDLDDKTLALAQPKKAVASEPESLDTLETARVKPLPPREETELRFGAVPNVAARRIATSTGGAVFTSAEASLKQSESLRIAQVRMTELESEVERLRRENERLASAGETLRRRADEMIAKAESLEISGREAKKIFDEEKNVLRGQAQAKERENIELRQKLEELEQRVESNFKKIRVRERELEHRLEIVRMENATLIGTKDKMILELKRQIDQLTHEADYSKVKSQEMFNQFKDKQETIRRVVRALRIAMTILEGEDDPASPYKKAD